MVSESAPAGNDRAAAIQLSSAGYCALAPVQLAFIFAQYFSAVAVEPPELLELELLELLSPLLLAPEEEDEEDVVSPVVSSLQPRAKTLMEANKEPTRRMPVLVIR